MDWVFPNQMAVFKIKSVCRLSCWKQESNICCPECYPHSSQLQIHRALWEHGTKVVRNPLLKSVTNFSLRHLGHRWINCGKWTTSWLFTRWTVKCLEIATGLLKVVSALWGINISCSFHESKLLWENFQLGKFFVTPLHSLLILSCMYGNTFSWFTFLQIILKFVVIKPFNRSQLHQRLLIRHNINK